MEGKGTTTIKQLRQNETKTETLPPHTNYINKGEGQIANFTGGL